MRWLLPALILLAGCASPEAPPEDDPTQGPHVVLAGDGFWDRPLPSDGRFAPGVDLTGFPNPDAVDLVEELRTLGQGMTGGGTTSSVYFRLEVPVDEASLPTLEESVTADASVFLVGIQEGSPDFGVRVPIDVRWTGNAAPFGPTDLLSLLPLQGRPLLPDTRYAAVVTRDLRARGGQVFGHNPLVAELEAVPGIEPTHIAGLATFTTQDPQAELRAVHADLVARPLPTLTAWTPAGDFPDYCAFEATLEMPVYQHGDSPFNDGGGTFVWDGDVPLLAGFEAARAVLTVPRGEQPSGGWPVAYFVRTGGGGDVPLMHRGVRDADGVAPEGTGYAADFAQVGFAGLSLDGPHGGLRNVTGQDEQFLMFNVSNPGAMRDNVRQSALELTLVPDLVEGMSAPDCGGGTAAFDAEHLALFGHSMGATIGPLTLGLEPRFGAAIFSGGGGSWIHNVVHKQSPLEVRPLAEAMLNYGAHAQTLTEEDPVLSLLQWAGESADPPVWGASIRAHGTHVLMLQGIVDTYILPPMANALSLSLGLDRVGPEEDAAEERLDGYRSLGEVLHHGAGQARTLPWEPSEGPTRAVVQHLEDGVEDGHEAAFQQPGARAQVRCFLADFAADRVPRVTGVCD